jgi:WD40 repeat protein
MYSYLFLSLLISLTSSSSHHPSLSHPQPGHATPSGHALAVTAWDGSYGLFLVGQAPRPLSSDVALGFDPCAAAFVHGAVLLGGSDQRVSVFTAEGRYLRTLSTHEDWVWSIAVAEDQDSYAVGTNVRYIITIIPQLPQKNFFLFFLFSSPRTASC